MCNESLCVDVYIYIHAQYPSIYVGCHLNQCCRANFATAEALEDRSKGWDTQE